jgi:hypothetical protein
MIPAPTIELSRINRSALRGVQHSHRHLSEIRRIEDWDYNFLPSLVGTIPSQVVSADRLIKIQGALLDRRPGVVFGAHLSENAHSIAFFACIKHRGPLHSLTEN